MLQLHVHVLCCCDTIATYKLIQILTFCFLVNIDDCVNNQCENDAVCVDGVNEYSCQCTPGFLGDMCSCKSRQLKLFVLCKSAYYVCQTQIKSVVSLDFTYRPSICIILDVASAVFPWRLIFSDHICDVSMCFNDGSCSYSDVDDRGYACACADGFSGSNCQSKTYPNDVTFSMYYFLHNYEVECYSGRHVVRFAPSQNCTYQCIL